MLKKGGFENSSVLPVSYNLLRAHDTKAKLLCRLLLKKKNFLNKEKVTILVRD